MSFLRQMFGGGVSEDDPRRFLIEAMLGAMGADGDITDEEMDTLSRTLEEHELFRDISKDARGRLIDIAADALRDAGDGVKRVSAIAKGLKGRTHNLMAYAMACEICVADGEIPESEIRYLDALQRAVDLDDETAKDIFEGVRENSGLQTIE